MSFCGGFTNGPNQFKIQCNVRLKHQNAMPWSGLDISSNIVIEAGIIFSVKNGFQEISRANFEKAD
jgi:hypothetical protein